MLHIGYDVEQWREHVLATVRIHHSGSLLDFAAAAAAHAITQGVKLQDINFLSMYYRSLEKVRGEAANKKPAGDGEKVELMIPEHWRRYAAHELGIAFSEASRPMVLSEEGRRNSPTPQAQISPPGQRQQFVRQRHRRSRHAYA